MFGGSLQQNNVIVGDIAYCTTKPEVEKLKMAAPELWKIKASRSNLDYKCYLQSKDVNQIPTYIFAFRGYPTEL